MTNDNEQEGISKFKTDEMLCDEQRQEQQEKSKKPVGIQLLESIQSDQQAIDLIYNGADDTDTYETDRSAQAFQVVASEFRNTHKNELEEFKNFITSLRESPTYRPRDKMDVAENLVRFTHEGTFYNIIDDAVCNSNQLAKDVISNKPDMIYNAPRGTFFPALIAKACFQELEQNFSFSKYFDQNFKIPYFFYPHNKEYNVIERDVDLFDLGKIVDTYPNSASIPDDSTQIITDLDLDDTQKETVLDYYPDDYSKRISMFYKIVEEAAESIKAVSVNHPSEQISIAIYDESKCTGMTLMSLRIILENARKKLPDIKFQIKELKYTNGMQSPHWFRPLSVKERELQINHRGNNPLAFRADQMTFELARLLGKQLAKQTAYEAWHKEHPFDNESQDQELEVGV